MQRKFVGAYAYYSLRGDFKDRYMWEHIMYSFTLQFIHARGWGISSSLQGHERWNRSSPIYWTWLRILSEMRN